MQAKLTVTGGKANKSELSVTVPVIVGRSRAAGLTIAHAMVSREHCEIFEAGGVLRIRDLGSTNGTYVGGSKVEEAVLRPHDRFTIGPLTFEIDYGPAGDSTIVEERIPGHAGTSPAAVLSSEAHPDEGEHPPAGTPAPALTAETAEPPESLSDEYAEFAESAIAEPSPAPEGFDFLSSPSELFGPPAPAGTFESAESAEEFMPAEESEAPVEYPDTVAPLQGAEPPFTMPAEPPAEFAEPGPEVSAMDFPEIAPPDGRVPDFLACSEFPAGDVPAPGAAESADSAQSVPAPETESPQDDVPAFPAPPIASPPADNGSISGQVPIWGDSSGAETDRQDVNAWDSDPNTWDPSAGDTQTAPFIPADRPGERKTKTGWWPFGKGK